MTPHVGRAPVLAWALAAAGLVVVVGSVLAERWTNGTINWRDALIAVTTLVVGARVASHAPGIRYGWWLLVAGLAASASVGFALATSGFAGWISTWVWFPGYAVLALTGSLFPDGCLPSTRWRLPIALVGGGLAVGVVGIASYLGRGAPAPDGRAPNWDEVVSWVGLVSLLIAAVIAPIAVGLKVRRADPAERGPLLWGVGSAVLLVIALILEAIVGPVAGVFAVLVFPLATVVAIARYGLYDIGTVVHRSLLYGTLTLALMGIYAATLTVAVHLTDGGVFEGLPPGAAAPAAAAIVALAVLPLRRWLQRLIDRRLYGTTGRPYELVTSLARGVGTALTPEEMLTAVVDGVAEGLRVPYVAVVLEPQEQPERMAGIRRRWSVTSLDLVHRGSTIGQLVVQQRAPDEPWTRRERELLRDLALQVAAPAATVRLIRDLQHARERLVTTREEERRRLRKDLHDGVGPALSGARMQLRAAVAGRGPGLDDTAMQAIEDDLSLASTELRRAIEGLRPPALDRGLAAALAGVVDRHAQSGLRIDLAMEDRLDPMPAAVEVALYRVLDEALTNCVRHAEASRVTVRIGREAGRPVLTVVDDGRGYAGPRAGGVGTESMRQRCEELGGSFAIDAAEPTGTRVRAAFGAG